MPIIDLQISAKIRAILARHWIDAEKLHFRTTAGTVRFHGLLARYGSLALCDIDPLFVEVLADEIQRVQGVEKVYFTGVEIERRKRVIGTAESHVMSSHRASPKRTTEPEPLEVPRESEVPGQV